MVFKKGSFILSLMALAWMSGSSTAVAGAPDPAPGKDECKVKLEKIGPKQIRVGSFFDYFLRVENKSHCTFFDLDLLDRAPERVQFESAYPKPVKLKFEKDPTTAQPSGFLEKVLWRIPFLGPHDVKIIHLRVHVVGPPNRTLVNKACLISDQPFERKLLSCDKIETDVVTGGAE